MFELDYGILNYSACFVTKAQAGQFGVVKRERDGTKKKVTFLQ